MSLEPGTPRPRRSRASRRKVARWTKRILLVVLGGLIAALLVRALLPDPVMVDVDVARRTALDVEVDEDGVTRVRDLFTVTAPITGQLQRIELDPGAPVARGDVVARIAPPVPALLDERSRSEAEARLDAAIARERGAAAAVARTTARRDLAIRDAGRARALVEAGAIPISQRDQAELAEELAKRDVAAAEADRRSAAAEVEAARAVLAASDRGPESPMITVVAPVPGQVLRVLRDSAGAVALGAPLLEIGDPRDLEVVIDVLSSDATRIEPGMQVAIEEWGGGAPIEGRVRRVEPSAFTRVSALGVEEQRVNVIVDLLELPPALGDRFRVEARIFVWRGTGVLTVPASALFRDRGGWAVFVVEDGRAELRPVVIGHRGRLAVEIVRGLEEGTRLVLHPSDQVRDGARVRLRERE